MTERGAAGRSPTPRAEGIQHMVDAAVALLRELPPEQVTVRAVAERAGHHHRFVSEWFGSKAGLFRVALDALLDKALVGHSLLLQRGGMPPDVRTAIHLMAWLVANDQDQLTESRPSQFRDVLVTNFVEVLGLDPDLADLLAVRVVAGIIGIVLFGEVMGIDDDTFERMRELELRVALLLAADQG